MFKPAVISLLLFLAAAGCGLINSKEKQDKFEPVFKARVNGELFNGTGFYSEQIPPRAGMSVHSGDATGEYLSLTIAGSQFYEDIFPYNEKIVFVMIYEEDKMQYPIQWDTVQTGETSYKFSGARVMFFEKGGDVLVTGYENLGAQEGYITATFDTLKSGEVTVFGTFETVVTTAFGASPSYSTWHGVDTLHITNGEYRVLLRDRRNE